MPVIATKSPKKSSAKSKPAKVARQTNGTAVVLTLDETATYLRVSPADVLHAVEEQSLPARRVRNDWRILKSALDEWLRIPVTNRNFWNTQLGALGDDSHLENMLQETYRQRGRPMLEDA